MPAEKKSSILASRFLVWTVSATIGLAVVDASRGAFASEHHRRSSMGVHLAQEKEGELPPEDTDVPPPEVDKYIKVYQAMQRNRNLTVEQAAAQQGLSVSAFRSLENRIQRNDALREHVRDSLKPQASPTPAQ